MLRSIPSLAQITISIDPFIDLGPISLSWHGITTSLGIVAGSLLAAWRAKRLELDPEEILTLAVVAALAGLVGARLLYLLENDAGALLSPADWLGTGGFSVYGGLIAGAVAIVLVIRRRNLSLGYLDAAALGLPLGMAIGRVGDLINGEHFGPPSQLPWAVRNSHPDASVPDAAIAYHSGGLYEILLALLILCIIWPLKSRLNQPGSFAATVVGLYASGRFAMFFVRSDSAELAVGLSATQWISVLLIATSLLALGLFRGRRPREDRAPPGDPTVRRRSR
ncbi:prolipoprotein diacylglyceryl transferase [Thermoleophilia bacterium SCSIO 60948]|nr:prolipoprotein diacylglyceryl transferase [Thermoleophilia bacterium SCSIO 60948]